MTDPSPSEVNGRFKVLPGPANLPGSCGCCGAVNREVVDFGLDIRFFGTLYLCKDCLTEAASRIGMVPEARLQDNQRETDQIVWAYLDAHKLKVITDEQHRLLVSAMDGLSDFAHGGSLHLPVENNGEESSGAGENSGQLALFDFDDDGNTFGGEFSSSDSSSSGRSSSVSADALSRLE